MPQTELLATRRSRLATLARGAGMLAGCPSSRDATAVQTDGCDGTPRGWPSIPWLGPAPEADARSGRTQRTLRRSSITRFGGGTSVGPLPTKNGTRHPAVTARPATPTAPGSPSRPATSLWCWASGAARCAFLSATVTRSSAVASTTCSAPKAPTCSSRRCRRRTPMPTRAPGADGVGCSARRRPAVLARGGRDRRSAASPGTRPAPYEPSVPRWNRQIHPPG
jgi:hypothetical protein